MILLLCLSALLQISLCADVTASISGEDKAGNRSLILENELLKATFSTLGGRLTGLVDKKSGIDFVWDNGKSESGSFKDQFPPQQFDFRDSQYSGQIVQNTPEKGVIVIRSQATSGKWKFLTIRRTYTLMKNERVLKCDLELQNQPESMAPMTLDYWQHNFFGVKGEENRFFVPTQDGTVNFAPSEKTNLNFFREPVRGWFAMIGRSGNGVVILPEYKRLELVYAWWCKDSLPLDTVEWRMIPEKIKAGSILKTSYALGVIAGLDRIDGAGNDGCGRIEVPSDAEPGNVPLRVRLTGFTAKNVTLRLFLNDQAVAEQNSKLIPGQSTAVSFELRNVGKGVHKLVLQVSDAEGKNLLFDLASALRVGKAKGKVTFAALEPRIKPAGDQEKWQFDLSDAVVTPHCEWLAGKKESDILFLVPVNGIRDVIEMKQRMPLKVTAPTVFPRDFEMPWRVNVALPPGSAQNGTEFVADYLRKRQYQAIVIGSEIRAPWDSLRVRWVAYPAEARAKILEQVRNGAGLVYINPAGEDETLKQIFAALKPLPPDIPGSMDFSAAPYFSKTEICTGNYGKGRIAVIRYPVHGFLAPQGGGRSNDFQTLKNDHRYQEYQFAILCRLLNWSMGGDPVLTSLKLDGKHLALESRAAGTVTVDLFNRYSQKFDSFTRTVQKGTNSIPVRRLSGGMNYAHVRFEDKDFGFASCVSKPSERILGLTLNASYSENEPVRGRVKLSEKAEKNCQVRVEITDSTGRTVHCQTGPVFMWDQKNAVVNRHTVRVQLLKDGTVIDEYRKSFNLPERFNALENFTNLLWAGSDLVPEYSIPYRWEAMRNFGFNFLYAGSTAEQDFCRLMQIASMEVGSNWLGPGMFHSNEGVAQWEKTHDKKYLVRPQCPNNPNQWNPAKAGAPEDLFRDFGTRHVFQLGDEMSITYYNTAWDVCFCDYCKKDFREWLKKRYVSLAALNEEWAATFKSWDEVAPMTRIEIMMHESPAPWVEHRLYMDHLFARTMQDVRANLRQKYPEANVGPTGVNNPPHVYGGNWNFREMSCFECASIYGTGRIPLSFNRDRRLIMQYRGYTNPEAVTNYSFWEGVFAGERSTNNWYEPIFVLPDLRESEVRQYYKKILWELRGGIGDLLYHSSKITDQVAVLHSQNSLISNFIKQKKSDYYAKELSFADALEDMGIAYRFIAPDEIKSGVLKHFKALILPEASALSDDEINAIRAFVQNGGTLIADYEPGIQNEVCNTRKIPALNDIFGIETGRFQLRRVKSHGIPGMELHLAGTGVKALGGRPLCKAVTDKGEVPLVITGNCAKGKTAFLNFVPEYNQNRLHGKDKGFLLLLDSLLKLESPAKVDSETPVMHSYYRNGGNLYIALLPVPPRGEWEQMTSADLRDRKFTVPLRTAGKGYLYDVRSGKYLGHGNTFDLTLVPGDGTLLALLPYVVRGIHMELPEEAKRGEIITVNAKVQADSETGHHVLLMTVVKPDGSGSLEYRTIRNTKNGCGVFQIPFALNDPKGKWRICIKDSASGVAETRIVTLK